MSYQLCKGVFFVSGAYHGVLIDTNNTNLYSVNRLGCQIISEKILDESYWKELCQLNLAEQSQNPRESVLPYREIPMAPRFIWLEISSSKCNLRCLQCYASCPKQPQIEKVRKPYMYHEHWEQVLKEAFFLGCRKCQITGGEPLLYKSDKGRDALDLAEYAILLGYSTVEIYTNGTLITDQHIRRIEKLGISLAVTLYSSDPSIHDQITQVKGSHAKTLRALQALSLAKMKVRVEIPLMLQNEGTIEETVKLRATMGFKGRNPDPIRPTGEGLRKDIQPLRETIIKYGAQTKPLFNPSLERLEIGVSMNPCLWGKLAILESGDIIPCVFSRDQILGNLREETFTSVCQSKKTREIWGMSKDGILVCQDCEYRYLCGDCRPLSSGGAEKRANYENAPYPRCTYNPYKGEWGKGLWRVDKEGNPYYDAEEPT